MDDISATPVPAAAGDEADSPEEADSLEGPSAERDGSGPRQPGWRRWTIAGLCAALFASGALGFGLEARLRARYVVSSPATGSGSTGQAPAGTGLFAPSAVPATGAVPAGAAAVASKVNPAVVDINTRLGYQNAAAAGTGMVLTPSGEVLTNNHVVNGATSISVTLVATGRTYSADVVGTDPTDDVALLQLRGASGLKTISVGDSSGVGPGEPVVGIGNAGGAGGSPSVVTGSVQAVNQTITASDDNGAGAEQLSGLIETDLPLQPGDSGGPLANRAGQVIGMDTAASAGYRFQSVASTAFAIPISKAVSIARQIESGRATATVHIGSPGFLGIAVQDSGTGQGALVTGVASGSPAEAAGLSQGDVIVSVGGQTVDSAQALTTRVKAHRPGDRIALAWTDAGGQTHRATVVLGTGPAD